MPGARTGTVHRLLVGTLNADHGVSDDPATPQPAAHLGWSLPRQTEHRSVQGRARRGTCPRPRRTDGAARYPRPPSPVARASPPRKPGPRSRPDPRECAPPRRCHRSTERGSAGLRRQARPRSSPARNARPSPSMRRPASFPCRRPRRSGGLAGSVPGGRRHCGDVRRGRCSGRPRLE